MSHNLIESVSNGKLQIFHRILLKKMRKNQPKHRKKIVESKFEEQICRISGKHGARLVASILGMENVLPKRINNYIESFFIEKSIDGVFCRLKCKYTSKNAFLWGLLIYYWMNIFCLFLLCSLRMNTVITCLSIEMYFKQSDRLI